MQAKIPYLTPQQKAQILGDDVPPSAISAQAAVPNPLAGLHTLWTPLAGPLACESPSYFLKGQSRISEYIHTSTPPLLLS
jgi:hypothetical protein